MKTITQYKEDIKSLMKKASDIDAKCLVENRDPTEQELNLKQELFDTVDEFQKIVVTQERQERMSNILEKPEPKETIPTGRIEVGVDNRSKQKFGGLGDNLAAVITAGRPGGRVDPRLYNAATGLNETVPSDGGLM